MNSDPYKPPETTAPVTEEVPRCPGCGATMEAGRVHGRLYWLRQKRSFLEILVSHGKKIVGPRPFSIGLFTATQTGFLCPSCGLAVILPR